jgi:hypothetical protein
VSFSPAGFDLLPVGTVGADGQTVWADEQPAGTTRPGTARRRVRGITSEQYDLQDGAGREVRQP